MIRICAENGYIARRNATLKRSDPGKRRMRGGYGGSGSFLGDGYLLFISMIVFCGRERVACGEENGSVSRLREGWEEGSGRLRSFIYIPAFTPS